MLILENMSNRYGINPSLKYYTCMVDLLKHAEHLRKAIRLKQYLPSSEYTIICCTLFDAFPRWGDVNMGRWAFKSAISLIQAMGQQPMSSRQMVLQQITSKLVTVGIDKN